MNVVITKPCVVAFFQRDDPAKVHGRSPSLCVRSSGVSALRYVRGPRVAASIEIFSIQKARRPSE